VNESKIDQALRLLHEIRVNLEAEGALDSDYHDLFDRVNGLLKSSRAS
jgi:hypothetical protein